MIADPLPEPSRSQPPLIRLIGLPTDSHSSFLRGAAAAPPLIREALRSDHSNLAAESGAEIGVDVLLDDAGDLPLAEEPADDDRIRAAVTDALAAGAVPLALGGDHSVSFPVVEAVAAAHGPVDILHFDAHPDLYDDFEGDPRSHASPFARIMEGGHARRLVQVGIRTLNRHCREQAERFGVEIVPMRGFSPERVPVLSGPVYVSIDLDGFDPSIAPGVSHHEPGGLTVREVLAVLDRIEGPLVGADIVEYNPGRDVNGVTAVLAAKLVKEIAALALRTRLP
ncbi:agmatinase family protein [Sphingosinicella humi]|uniref:Agmatinase n=1 Tax=Allosphingosinicella humi TaxID=2068657 RepID=A0A2U2IYM1_9SPHN|nr:agmatinase family protein [Sphingosinicella humi]PWG01192.1 agmatinase [Sphingosinicella humi]